MQIPDEVRKSVFFILYQDKAGFNLAGTGFFISTPTEVNPETSFIYLTTAKHVIVNIQSRSIDQIVWLRINTKEGGSVMVSSSLSSWRYSEDTSVDVAVLSWGPDAKIYDYLSIPVSMAATDEVISSHRIGIGDEVFLTGLFSSHSGKKKNIPIIRTGAIASMPEEPISTPGFGDMHAYLIEARSIGGLSGSPVFVFLSTARRIGENIQLGASSIHWLGVMHGHWDIPHSVTDTVVFDGVSKQSVNMGIAIVVPVQEVLKILEQTDFVDARNRYIESQQPADKGAPI